MTNNEEIGNSGGPNRARFGEKYPKTWYIKERLNLGNVGLGETVSALEELFSGDEKLAVLTGEPGVGKTQAALEYAHGKRSEYPDGVIFLDATNLETLEADCQRLIEQQKRQYGKDNSTPELVITQTGTAVESVAHWLKDREHSLVVLENASEENLDTATPIMENSTHLLLTSSQPISDARNIKLEPLNETNGALALARSSQFIEYNQGIDAIAPKPLESAQALSRLAGGNPKKLSAMARYIEATGGSFTRMKEYIELGYLKFDQEGQLVEV